MASYFEEFNFTPLEDGQQPNHALHLARLLLDTGHVDESDWSLIFPNGKPPPAAKNFTDLLEKVAFKCENFSEADQQCPICILRYAEGEEICHLPACKHLFHRACLIVWLKKTSTCPLCRQDLPTDDRSFENYKDFKKNDKKREAIIKDLHEFMYA